MIKTILSATDFSDAATNAYSYATYLAKAFKAKVMLFNAYQPLPVPVSHPVTIVTPADMQKDVRRKLRLVARSVEAYDIHTEILCEQGNTIREILKAATDHHADVIITGMKKQHKGIGKLFGSTVTALIRKTRIPLIIIPEKADLTPIRTIALVIDRDIDQDDDVNVFSILRELVHGFHATLYLVRTTGYQLPGSYDPLQLPGEIKRMMKDLHPLYDTIEGKDPAEGLNNFVMTNHIDMLALLTDQHSMLGTLFVKSLSRSMAFETHVPLLILPGLKS